MYSALVKLGEIDNTPRHGDVAPSLAKWWTLATREEEISDEMLSSAVAEAKEKVSRLGRMLRIGTSFTYEELLLAITTRIELQLLSSYLSQRGLLAAVDLHCLDGNLLALARSSEHMSIFRSAQAAAKRNWGVFLSGLNGWEISELTFEAESTCSPKLVQAC